MSRVSETSGNLSKITQQVNSRARIVLTPVFAYLRTLSLSFFWLVDVNYILPGASVQDQKFCFDSYCLHANYGLLLLICFLSSSVL